MATLLIQRDFMLGAAIYSLLQVNKDARLSLIESHNDYARLNIMTDTTGGDVGIYMKYTMEPRGPQNESSDEDDEGSLEEGFSTADGSSTDEGSLMEDEDVRAVWTINLRDSDKAKIVQMFSEKQHALVIFILGNKFKSGEVLILTKSEYAKIAHKKTISICLDKGAKKLIIAARKKEEVFRVSRNRLEKKLDDICCEKTSGRPCKKGG